ADLVRRVDDHDSLAQIVGQNARGFAQQRRFAHAWAAHHEDAAARLDNVANNGDRAIDRAPHAARDADDAAFAIADRRDAMQRALDAGPIVVAKNADALDDVLD